jgi:YgiT-type zinc finger domain-containing protein
MGVRRRQTCDSDADASQQGKRKAVADSADTGAEETKLETQQTSRSSVECGRCGRGERRDRLTSITLAVGESTIVFRCVPARVCDTCADEVVAASVARELERIAHLAIVNGVRHQIRQFPHF